MKQIYSISLARLNNGAHYLFVSKVLKRAEANAKVSTRAAAQVAALKSALAKEDEYLKISQKSLITDDITNADAERDSLYISYKNAVKGLLTLPVEELAKAARVLNQHIKDYGIDVRMQLDRETGLMENFLTDLEGKFAPQVETLRLGPVVEQLRAANNKLTEFTDARTDERVAINVGALKAARLVTDEAYRQFVMMVNALAVVEGEADYAAFIDYMNTEIVHYKREAMGQKTPGAETDTPAGDTGDTDTPGGEDKPATGGDTPGTGGTTPGTGGGDSGDDFV